MKNWYRFFQNLLENDEEHAEALDKTGFWGKKAAGCIIFAKNTKKFCIAHRSQFVLEPNTWGTWGGAIDASEVPQEAVLRELKEETGLSQTVDEIVPLYVFKSDKFRYYNFVVIIENEYKPNLNWENQGYVWCDLNEIPEPKHFGLVDLLKDSESINFLKSLVD